MSTPDGRDADVADLYLSQVASYTSYEDKAPALAKYFAIVRAEERRRVAAEIVEWLRNPPAPLTPMHWCAICGGYADTIRVRCEKHSLEADARREMVVEIIAFLREQDEHNAADEIQREWLR